MQRTSVGLIVILALGILSAPLASDAQPPHIRRSGILSGASPPAHEAPSPWHEALQQGLQELGWLEGQNVTLVYRFAEGRFERFPLLAAELVELRVDVIVASLTPALKAAKQATATIPIVMAGPADPVGTSLVDSLRRPGGNITGVSAMGVDLTGKRLELLKEAVPKVSRLGMLWYRDLRAWEWGLYDDPMVRRLGVLEGLARRLGLVLQPVEVGGSDYFESAFATLIRERSQALFVTYDPLTVTHRRHIVELAAQHRLPAIYELRDFVDLGGLMSYGPSRLALFRRAAIYVDKILKGAKPGALPVEQPTKFELVLNMKTAQALGITFPPTLLILADQVLQ